jgi:hypothetical protein
MSAPTQQPQANYRGFSIFTDARLTNEITRAKSAEQKLETDLANEELQRNIAVGNLQLELSHETQARQSAIQSEQLARENAISSEKSERENAVGELNGRLGELETWRVNNTDEINQEIDKLLNQKITIEAVNDIVQQLESVDSSLNQALVNAVTERKSQDVLHQMDLNDIYEYLQLHAKTFKIEDIVSSDSERANAIKADGEAPVSSPLGGWDYTKSPTHSSPKINWYFYGDEEKKQTFGSVECFYIKMVVPDNADNVWITAYTHKEDDGQDAASWYRSRWSMSGYYEEGGVNVPRNQEIVMYFSPVGKTPREVFTHLAPMPQLDILTHNASGAEYLQKGPRDESEKLRLVALTSDSGAVNTSVLVKEVGFKFTNRLPRVLALQ